MAKAIHAGIGEILPAEQAQKLQDRADVRARDKRSRALKDRLTHVLPVHEYDHSAKYVKGSTTRNGYTKT